MRKEICDKRTDAVLSATKLNINGVILPYTDLHQLTKSNIAIELSKTNPANYGIIAFTLTNALISAPFIKSIDDSKFSKLLCELALNAEVNNKNNKQKPIEPSANKRKLDSM
jgi:hypothetical protein